MKFAASPRCPKRRKKKKWKISPCCAEFLQHVSERSGSNQWHHQSNWIHWRIHTAHTWADPWIKPTDAHRAAERISHKPCARKGQRSSVLDYPPHCAPTARTSFPAYYVRVVLEGPTLSNGKTASCCVSLRITSQLRAWSFVYFNREAWPSWLNAAWGRWWSFNSTLYKESDFGPADQYYLVLLAIYHSISATFVLRRLGLPQFSSRIFLDWIHFLLRPFTASEHWIAGRHWS